MELRAAARVHHAHGEFLSCLGVGQGCGRLPPAKPARDAFRGLGRRRRSVSSAASIPLLEAAAIAEILEAVGASVLVTLGPGGAEGRGRSSPVLPRCGAAARRAGDPESGCGPEIATLYLKPARTNWRPPCARRCRRACRPMTSPAVAGTAGRKAAERSRIHPDDCSSFFCTGGTTGAPKIAVRSHGNEVSNARSLAQVRPRHRPRQDDVLRPAAVPRQCGDGNRPAAVLDRRARAARYGAGLSWRGCARQLLGDRGAPPR